jgi:hypothetical protein
LVVKFLDWIGRLLVKLRHGHILPHGSATPPPPPPPPPPPGDPTNTVLPRFVDVDGVTITAPLSGQWAFPDIGTWIPAADSYLVQAYDDNGAIYGTSQPFVSGEPMYLWLEADEGHSFRLGVTPVVGGVSLTEVLSTATSNVGSPSFGAPTLARTSVSGAQLAFTIAFPSGVSSGPDWQTELERYDPTTGTSVLSYFKEITALELTGPSYDSYWNNSYGQVAPYALDTSIFDGTDLLRGRVICIQPGSVIYGDWSDWITPTDLTFGPELIIAANWVPVDATVAGGVLTCTSAAQLAYNPVTLAATNYRISGPYTKTGITSNSALRLSLGTTNNADPRFTTDSLADGSAELIRNFTSDIAGPTAISIEAAVAQLKGSFGPFSVREIL